MLTPSEIYQTLLAAYGRPRWWSEDPYRVMFQAVLVQNTAWTNVEKTCDIIYRSRYAQHRGRGPAY